MAKVFFDLNDLELVQFQGVVSTKATVVRLGNCDPIPQKGEKTTHYEDGSGWYVGAVWNGSFHDCWYFPPQVVAWVGGGRKKRLKRLNRLFREARDYLASLAPGEALDPCVARFRARNMVRSGD